MNTQTETSNINGNNGNTDATELDGGTVKFWLREMRIDRVLASGSRNNRKVRGSRRASNVTVSSVAAAPSFVPSIPEGVSPDDVIPGTGWTYGDALEEALERSNA